MIHTEIIPFEVMKVIATSECVPGLFTGHQTHNLTLRLVCDLAKITSDVEYVTNVITDILPENYTGNTIAEIPGIFEWASENPKSEETKKKPIEALLEHFSFHQIELFKNEEDRGFISIPNNKGGIEAVSIRSRQGKLTIRRILYKQLDINLRGNDFSDLLNTLESVALFEGGFRELRLRTAQDGANIIFDIGDDDRSVIICNKKKWEVQPCTSIMFRRREGYKQLPHPETGGDLKKLRELLGIENDQAWYCFIAFIINALRPNGPYYCLIIDGEQGSGKSVLSTLIKNLIDPNVVAKLRFPRSDRDLMIQANQFYLIVFDNASGIKQNLSDSLCTIATGGGFATRTLHTDDDLKIFNVCRPFVINGIGGFAYNPDLLERGIHLTLPPMKQKHRKSEEELNQILQEIIPGVLGVFMDAVVEALNNIDNQPTPEGLRMADAARWIAAAEPAFGLPQNTLINALLKSQNETMAAVAIETALAQGIIKVLLQNNGKFEGGHSDLLTKLDGVGANSLKDPYFPKTPAHLSKDLTKFAPALKKAGIETIKLPRTNTGSRIEIRFDGTVNYSEESLGETPF